MTEVLPWIVNWSIHFQISIQDVNKDVEYDCQIFEDTGMSLLGITGSKLRDEFYQEHKTVKHWLNFYQYLVGRKLCMLCKMSGDDLSSGIAPKISRIIG